MAYAESTVGGSFGGNYRVWVNSIRTYDGGPSENFEEWRAEGGLNKVGGGTAQNGYGNSSYTLQLGLNGMASSGNFSYNFGSGTGRVLAWGTGTTRVYRNSAGVGFGFTSRMDINLQNSPYLTSGWVQSSDGVQTKYRHASLTALSTDQGGIPFTDEGPAWVEFSNPAGAAVDAFLEAAPSYARIYTSASGIGSRFNYPWSTGLTEALQQATPNSNTNTIRMGIHDNMGGDSWDYRDRTYTIKNDIGQANPIFSDFTYKDTDSAAIAVTGSDQVLVQGKSSLEVKVSAANAATVQKFANRGSYNFTIGGHSQNATWPSSGDVVQTVGAINDVTGVQSLAARAVDARGNGTTVSKNVTVLPYRSPGFYGALEVRYVNGFDAADGVTVDLFNNETLGSVSPMTLSGVNKNFVNTTSGVKFDVSKNDNTSYTGSKVNVTVTNQSNGYVNVDPATLGAAILSKMATLGLDNTTKWFITFEITDKFETSSYTVAIDIGRPIMRIGKDGYLYHNEVEMSQAFNDKQYWLIDNRLSIPVSGTWGWAGATGFVWNNAGLVAINTDGTYTPQVGDSQEYVEFLPKGTYTVTTFFIGTGNAAITRMKLIGGAWGAGVDQFDLDNYRSDTAENSFGLTGMVVENAGVYRFRYTVVGKNASSTNYYQRITGIRIRKTA